MNSEKVQEGYELGEGLKEALKNLNTNASPKSKKTCKRMIIVELILMLIPPIGLFVTGLHQFYLGRWGRGILYTCTYGFFFVGVIYDLIKLYQGRLRDASGFPVIY